MQCLGDNAYRVEFPGHYGVSATFNVKDLSPFDGENQLNSRTSIFQQGGMTPLASRTATKDLKTVLGLMSSKWVVLGCYIPDIKLVITSCQKVINNFQSCWVIKYSIMDLLLKWIYW